MIRHTPRATRTYTHLPYTTLFRSAAFTPAASADTLREARDQAYRSNPSLTGARAGLRALDEGVPQAKALGRPTFAITSGLTQSFRGIGRLNSGGRSLTANGDIDIPIFQGGKVRSAIKSAESRIDAGRADLRRSEEHTSELQSLMRNPY